MRKLFVILVLLSYALLSFRFEGNFNQEFKGYLGQHADRATAGLVELFQLVDGKDYTIEDAKEKLEACRLQYKVIEPFIIHFFPVEARILNSPVVPEMEEDDEVSAMVIPHGYQYLESLLYSDSVEFFRGKIKDEVDEVVDLMGRFSELISYMDFRERDVFEALQMHLVRQFMLGFANFETVESRAGVRESAATLLAFKDLLLRVYPDAAGSQEAAMKDLFSAIDKAVTFMNDVRPGDEPDFFTFYSTYYIPVSEQLVRMRVMSVEDDYYNTSALNLQVRSIFDPGAFNTFFFLPAKQLPSREAVIELGRTLFFDPALSANNLRACASCHQPGKAFTDGLAQSLAFEQGEKLKRNAPTIINSVLQRKLFHDGRAFTFEDQAGQVMNNPLEMHNNFGEVSVKLQASDQYVDWFRRAFAETEDTVITSRSILIALAEYERSLLGMNSRFDQTISGRFQVLTEDEKKGFNLFMGKADCASCHFLPLFNGLVPPEYMETDWEILGVPSLEDKHKLDKDIGRAGIVDAPIFMHAFKTPTLRNIELTAPYMHNGVFKTLEEVVDFYDAGGGSGLGFEVPFQTLGEDSLHLSDAEKKQLIAFMKSLTDTINLTRQPTKLPAFPASSELNDRTLGGQY